jgi:dephospho-CoA kinase
VAVERLRSRNGLSEEAALLRVNSQMSTAERMLRGHVTLNNGGAASRGACSHFPAGRSTL